MQTHAPVGVDIASKKFDVAAWKGDTSYKTRVFPNAPNGFIALRKRLEPFGNCHICLEATGAYSEPLAAFPHDEGYGVSVENPARIERFSQAELNRNKAIGKAKAGYRRGATARRVRRCTRRR